MKSTQRNVVMEQRADIKQILIGLGVPWRKMEDTLSGVNVTMIGPIQVTYENGSQRRDEGFIEINGQDVTALPPPVTIPVEKSPTLLRGIEQGREPMAPSVDETVMNEFEPIFEKLPEPKLNSTVRMVVEMAHRKDNSPKSVAKALNCSIYKARTVMQKFGLSS